MTLVTVLVLVCSVAVIFFLSLREGERTARAQENSSGSEQSDDREPSEGSADSEEQDVFDLSIEKQTQSIFTQTIPLKLKIISSIDSDRLQVRWTVPQRVVLETEAEIFTEIKKNEPVYITARIRPTEGGDYRVIAEVQAWEAELNYADAEYVDLKIADDLQIQPQTEEYKNNLKAWNVAKYACCGSGVIVVGLLIFFAYKRFRQWMETD